MRKEPKCKNCGGRHYTYQCWSKPKTKPKARRTIKKVSSTDLSYRRKIIAELDRITSIVVRQRGCDRNGYNTCYTCGAKYHWKDLDCGHYIKRGYMQTRWELANLRPQCRHCNRILSGNYSIYERKIRQELGTDEVQKLWDRAYKTDKISTIELELLLTKMKKLLLSTKKV